MAGSRSKKRVEKTLSRQRGNKQKAAQKIIDRQKKKSESEKQLDSLAQRLSDYFTSEDYTGHYAAGKAAYKAMFE